MPESTEINLSFRPVTYWPESLTLDQLLSRIEGKARQEIARNILEQEGFSGLTAFLARPELSTEERSQWSSIHPHLMGGEYLPSLEGGAVEIARISLNSVTLDQISIRARRQGAVFFYQVVGEYEDDEGMRYVMPFDRSEHPLTLQELINLIDGSNIPDDIFSGGLMISSWCAGMEDGSEAETAVKFANITSVFYPALADYYAVVAREWVEENTTDEEDDDTE